jgi:spermidine/putrescine transport system permease protein
VALDQVRRAERRRGRLEQAAFLGPGLGYAAVLLLVPLGIVVTYAFFQRGRFGDVVADPTLENLRRLGDPIYRRVLWTSLRVAGLATLLALVVGYPAAMAIAALPARWRTAALIAVVLPFWTNFLIRTYAWIVLLNNEGLINSVLDGIGVRDEPVQLMNNQLAVVIGLTYAYLPLMILPLYASIERLDPSLREAALNLGASRLRAFVTVTLPLTLPGVLTGCIFVFVPSVGNFVVPELLGGGKTVLVGNLIRDQYLRARDWPFGSALAVSLIAIIVVLLTVQAIVLRRSRMTARA